MGNSDPNSFWVFVLIHVPETSRLKGALLKQNRKSFVELLLKRNICYFYNIFPIFVRTDEAANGGPLVLRSIDFQIF